MGIGALLFGLALAYPVVWGVRIVLGSFVTGEICPSGGYCHNPWSAVAWLVALIALAAPLAVQRTLVEVAMVTGDGKNSEVNRLAKQLLVVNERNERLIEGLLVLAEADRGLPGTVPVRLDELVASVLTGYTDQLAEHNLTLRRDLIARTVPGDPVLLERMIGNLVHNAIKYNNPGGWIEVVVAEQPALSVHNTGQRVPAESVTALFEPFRRLTADRTNHRDGAGLGLSIVRSIATAHSGTASAAPGDEGGLRVNVSLPLTNPKGTAEHE